jgi:hypothetical protein
VLEADASLTVCMPSRNHYNRSIDSSSRLPLNPLDSNSETASDRFSTPVLLSAPSSRTPSRAPSPSAQVNAQERFTGKKAHSGEQEDASTSDAGFDNWTDDWNDEEEEDCSNMPSDLRAPLHRSEDGRLEQPLLGKLGGSRAGSPNTSRPQASRRATFHERDPELEAQYATQKRYSYAAFFLLISLITFAVQTETAVYIQHTLKWNKAYCML